MSDVLCGCKGCARARQPLEDAIQRVRELHKQIDGIGVKVCAVCIDDRMYWTEQTNYPCDTIKALDGEQ